MGEGNRTPLLAISTGIRQPIPGNLFTRVYPVAGKTHSLNRYYLSGSDAPNTAALVNDKRLKSVAIAKHCNSLIRGVLAAAKTAGRALASYVERATAARRTVGQAPPEDWFMADSRGLTVEDLVFIHRLLIKIEEKNARRCRIAECRIFGGMSVEETAQLLRISVATVKRDWTLLSTWLCRELDLKQKKRNDRMLNAR